MAGPLLPAALVVACLALAACGSGETEANTDISNSGPGVTVTVPPAQALSSATPAPTTTAMGGSGSASSAGQQLTVTARDNVFDPQEMSMQANQSTAVTLRNQGTAIHNWEILNVTDKDGKPVKTKLISGGQSDTIVFTMSRTGTFDYFCEVHPAEMRGKITVR
jgi:plastocyanin